MNTQSGPMGRCARAMAGILWLGFISAGVSGEAHRNFVAVFSFIFLGAIFTGTVLLVWMTRWALRREARSRQFSIATLLLIVALASIYFAAIRWIVVQTAPGHRPPTESAAVLGMVALFCALHALTSIPFVLGILDGMVWLSVWLSRRPTIQRFLSPYKPTGEPDTRGTRMCDGQY